MKFRSNTGSKKSDENDRRTTNTTKQRKYIISSSKSIPEPPSNARSHACVKTQDDECLTPIITSVKNIPTSDIPLFTMTINGSTRVKFQFDSGTSRSVICNDVVQVLSSKPYMLKPALRVELPIVQHTNVLCTEGITLDPEHTSTNYNSCGADHFASSLPQSITFSTSKISSPTECIPYMPPV